MDGVVDPQSEFGKACRRPSMNHETGPWPPDCPLCGLPYPVRQPEPDGLTLRCRPGKATRLSLEGEPVEIAQAGANIFRAAAAFERDLFVIKPLEAVPTHVGLHIRPGPSLSRNGPIADIDG